MTLYIENDLIGQTEACMSTRDVWVYTSLKSLYTCSSNDIDRVAHEFIGENGRYHCGPTIACESADPAVYTEVCTALD